MPLDIKKIDTEALLEQIARDSNLLEGKESIRLILREIYREGTIGTKTLARKLLLPIPTVAAVRKELEKVGLIDRVKKGAILTEQGIIFAERKLGFKITAKLLCRECSATGIELPNNIDELIKKQADFSQQRPTPKTDIDQAFGKPITAIRRALIMLEKGDLEGRKILLLGDDDFTSLAIAQLKTTAKITVFDIDRRLLEIINRISKENNYSINCIEVDLRDDVPKNFVNQFDTVLTDPPYTLAGLELFLSRAIVSLKEDIGKKIYLAYSHRPSSQQLLIQKICTDAGLAIMQIIPGFNLYEGAEMHANTTYLAILSTTDQTKPLIKDKFQENIYTGELNPTRRTYRCSNNHLITVGSEEQIKTIEELKSLGCPICGSKEEFTLHAREKIQ